MIKNYYEFLNVNQNCTPEELKQAFKKQILLHYPTFGSAAEKDSQTRFFDELAEAYDVLSDQKNRALYDYFGYIKFKEGFQDKYGNRIGGYVFTKTGRDTVFDFCDGQEYFTKANFQENELKTLILQENSQRMIRPKNIIIERELSLLQIYTGHKFEAEFNKSVLNNDGVTSRLITQKKYFKKGNTGSTRV